LLQRWLISHASFYPDIFHLLLERYALEVNISPTGKESERDGERERETEIIKIIKIIPTN